jgi:hypothetical protein
MKKTKKHLKKLTADEAISHIFHPDALEYIKKHIEKINEKKKQVKKER